MTAWIGSQWKLDRERVLLTGLSDGATMSLLVGLGEDAPFTHLAPISGVLHPLNFAIGNLDRTSGKPIYLICNADESEPGTFKDRQIIHKDPHQLIEGMIISCWANDVNLAYIYIRGEFPEGGADSRECARRGP